MKILSISVAAYNAAGDLKRCIDSLVNTSVSSELDIIIVNDGSTDNTLEVASEYQRQYEGIVRVIDKPNGGHGSTINASLQVAEGKYYRLVDADDWVDKDGLETLVESLRDESADLVLTPYYEVDADTLQRTKTVYPYKEDWEIGVRHSIDEAEKVTLFMHSTTYKTEVLKKMGPIIDENCFYVDVEYTLFPLKFVSDFVCYNIPVYEYLLGTPTQSMNRDVRIKRREQHLKVLCHVAEYYEREKAQLSNNKSRVILRLARYVLLNQYKIYFSMKDAKAQDEVRAFDKKIGSLSTDVYRGPEGRFMHIVKFNRLTGFVLFPLWAKILRDKIDT